MYTIMITKVDAMDKKRLFLYTCLFLGSHTHANWEAVINTA